MSDTEKIDWAEAVKNMSEEEVTKLFDALKSG